MAILPSRHRSSCARATPLSAGKTTVAASISFQGQRFVFARPPSV
jgi:hypothetical protein